jgi:hypothetical protein
MVLPQRGRLPSQSHNQRLSGLTCIYVINFLECKLRVLGPSFLLPPPSPKAATRQLRGSGVFCEMLLQRISGWCLVATDATHKSVVRVETS